MRAVIFANGELANPASVLAGLRPDDWIIAADGGSRYTHALGLTPHVLIGDLDSVTPGERARLESAGCELIVYPVRKDATDLELALRLALTRAGEVLIFGALGARWDQTLANLLLLASPDFRGRPIALVDDRQFLSLGPGRLAGRPGDTVSLIPLAGDALGVTTRGLEYPLSDGILPFGSTLGVSNVMTGSEAEVSVREGLVLMVHIRGEL